MIQLRIKELSKEKNILLKDLADKIGISRVSLTRIAQGEQNPTMDTLEKLASELGVEVGELFNARSEHTFRCPYCGKKLFVSAEEQ